MTESAVAILPYGQGLGPRSGAVPLDLLHWPLGRPARLETGVVADMGPQDHLIVYPKTSMHVRRWPLRARISVMVVEPRVIHARHLMILRWTRGRYHRIFTHDPQLLAAAPNARFLAAARTWVPEWASLDLAKTEDISLIASARRDLEGHRLRHAVVEAASGIAVMGRGYAPFVHKHEGLAPYRFSVVIENVRAPGYFSEKLVDALLCETVPIYWGAPDIADHFDARGMIICNTLDEMVAAIETATPVRYDAMRAGLLRAKTQATALCDYEVAAARALMDDQIS